MWAGPVWDNGPDTPTTVTHYALRIGRKEVMIMVKFRVTPHPGEAQVLQGQNLARVLYSIGAEGGGGSVPIFLGVVLDVSGSMQGPKLDAAKDALIRLLGRVPASDNVVVHITLFNDTAEQLAALMTGRELSRNLQSLNRSIRDINAA